MSYIPQETGWSLEAKLLDQILKEIKRLQTIVSKGITYPTTTTTTTHP
jgi:hypothetical protein